MNKIKSFLKTNVLTKDLYRWLYNKKYSDRIEKNKRLQQYGNETLKFIQQVLDEHEISFFFDMGTLLGIIREGKIIAHDLDIDIAIIRKNSEEIEKVRKILSEAGCQIKYSYECESIGVVEDSFCVNEIKFDINYYYLGEESDYCYLMYKNPELKYERNEELSVVELHCSKICKIVKTDFMGGQVNIPENAKDYLEERYGKNWRVPDPDWIYWKGPSAVPINAKGRKIEYKI